MEIQKREQESGGQNKRIRFVGLNEGGSLSKEGQSERARSRKRS